ncbi:MAG TPA: PilN domain-containing protein [Pyrinomonadaceae bacterium]|nr:PilN domain-containing protein [Pyrinomonadaceae bacterium]HMP65887.1 PilN domain-containing protein [Pyrinomonadaceae bacterium]
MIKVNLLQSVTERQGGAVTAVDRTVGSPSSRLLLMSLAVGFLFLAVVGWDVISSQMAKSDAERRLEEQKQIAAELEVVMKEQRELEQKIQNIDMRIEAIKKLRANQAGPSAVLEAVRERIAMVPGLYLQAIEQTGDEVVIRGNSPDEAAVTQFGRSLEFSNGLFSNLNIETQRQEIVNQMASNPSGGEGPKVNVVNFTIKTAYTPSKAAGAESGEATTASAAQPGQAGAPAQVARNQ